jgi:hypothetical protein
MSTRSLWRIDGLEAGVSMDSEKLAAGLRLHLQHASLQTTLVQVGNIQRSYVALASCTGCARDTCEPGCYVALLRRLLHAAAPSLTLAPVSRGLRARPYTTFIICWPGKDAVALDGALLTTWPEARLSLHWTRAPHDGVAVGGLLAVADADTALRAVLREMGWRGAVLARPLRAVGTFWLRAGMHPPLWQRPTHLTPHLLFPALPHLTGATAASDDPEAQR